MSFYT